MTNKFRAVARQSYLDRGMPRVGREVVGLYLTRKEAEDACGAFVKSRGARFRPAYDDCIVELVLDAEKGKLCDGETFAGTGIGTGGLCRP
jgi:hypothetical protein